MLIIHRGKSVPAWLVSDCGCDSDFCLLSLVLNNFRRFNFFLVHSDSHSGPFEILGAANGGSSFDEADGSTPKEGTGTLMTLKSCGKQLHSNIPNRKTYIPKSRRGECEFVAPISE